MKGIEMNREDFNNLGELIESHLQEKGFLQGSEPGAINCIKEAIHDFISDIQTEIAEEKAERNKPSEYFEEELNQ